MNIKPLFFPEDETRWTGNARELRRAITGLFPGKEGRPLLFVLADENFDQGGFNGTSLPKEATFALAFHPTTPMDARTHMRVRRMISERDGIEHCAHVGLPKEPPDDWAGWLDKCLANVGMVPPSPTGNEGTPALRVRDHVRLGDESRGAYDSGLLTVHPQGAMGKVLNQLDDQRRRFRAMFSALTGKQIEDAKKQVADALKPSKKKSAKGLDIPRGFDRATCPRVLLLGESGTGKTLAARYLCEASEGKSVFRRVAVPSYLNKEDAFEYEVFGYTPDAYTGANEEGSPGLIVENLCGVAFFDEIGDASPSIQAKLLTYLDDYEITPRGWRHAPFFAPVFFVAATNHDIEGDVGRGDFRRDLLERFTCRVRIPALKEREPRDIDCALDAMLQMDSFNPDSLVNAVTEGFLKHLHEDIAEDRFKEKNFRLLEHLLRAACALARRQGDDTLQTHHYTTAWSETAE